MVGKDYLTYIMKINQRFLNFFGSNRPHKFLWNGGQKVGLCLKN